VLGCTEGTVQSRVKSFGCQDFPAQRQNPASSTNT
jgi:hypothetical protein